MTLELPAHPQLILRTAVVPADGILEGPRELRRLPEGAHEIPYELFGLRPLGRVIGAEIDGVDLAERLSPALRAELNRALLEWKVLFFRDQRITPAQQREFAATGVRLRRIPLFPRVTPMRSPGSHVARVCRGSRTSGTLTSRSGRNRRSVPSCA